MLARHGFSESELILNWDDIVGERLAASSRPIKLQWPARGNGGHPDGPIPAATLIVREESGFAIELQHMADQVLARINGHLGWRCVGRLAFRQGPIERQPSSASRRPAPSPVALAQASNSVVDVVDEALRSALARLGAHVMS